MTEKSATLQPLQLADALGEFASSRSSPPGGGWVRAIREALGMTQAQLAAKLGIARQSLQDLERAEANRRITLDSLTASRKRWIVAWSMRLCPRRVRSTTCAQGTRGGG